MKDWTYNELKTKVEDDLDLQRDTIIGPTEMLGYCNEAIREAEAEIHRLGVEDEYFLQKSSLPLVLGGTEINMPSDLYANKIKAIVYNDGSRIYEVKRLRQSHRFLEIEEINNTGSDEDYQYLIENKSRPVALDATTGRKILLYPVSRETHASRLTVWYVRNAARMVDETDLLDIPEFANFIMSFMKVRCIGKEGDPRYNDEVAVLQAQRKLMIETLTEMVPDGDDTMEADFTHYLEHS
jgi:hypothetical protein